MELAISNFQRLGALMQDILSYSEIGNAPQQRAVIKLGEPLDVAVANLQHQSSIVARQSPQATCHKCMPTGRRG